MSRYRHTFSIAYTVESDEREGNDLNKLDHLVAISKRAAEAFNNDELLEAVGVPDDTYDKVEDSAL
jgi:hypothetical protein